MTVKPYSKTKPSGIEWLGEIAYDWTVRPIKHLVSTPVTDGPHETPEIFDEGVPFVSAEAVGGGRINFEKIRGHITAEDHKRFSRKYKPRRGDIYLIKSGATTGRVAMVETDVEFNIWSPLAAIRCEPTKADRRFLFFYMQSREFRTAIELSWSFGTQQNIGMGIIQNLAVPLPSLPEQSAIAAFLDRETGRIDELVGKKKELIERLKEKRSALISACVTRGLPAGAGKKYPRILQIYAEEVQKSKHLRPSAQSADQLPENPPLKPSGIEWLGDVPEHWKPLRLKHLLRLQRGAVKTGPFGSQLQSVEMMEGEIKVYNQRSVITRDFAGGDNYISMAKFGELRAFEVFPNDLLVTTRGTIGRCAVLPEDAERGILHPCLMRVQFDLRRVSNRFAEILIQESGRVLEQLQVKSNATTIDVIYSESLREIWFSLPPLAEQRAIAAYLDAETVKIDALVAKVETAIERLQEFRSALITAAVTGKIDLREEAGLSIEGRDRQKIEV